jgi:triacylglycerol lipase
VRSSTDEVVQPQSGKHPASSLVGASNILIQNVCPGRKVSHLGTAVDSVTFAAFVDAITHNGPAGNCCTGLPGSAERQGSDRL